MPSRIKPKHPRPPTPCAECGKVSRKVGHLCAQCLGYESNALTGGRWVIDLRRRVQVWVVGDRPLSTVAGFRNTGVSKDNDVSRPRPELELHMAGASPTDRTTTDS